MSGTKRAVGDQARCCDTCDSSDDRCDAMQVEPEGTRKGGYALNDAACESCKVCDCENDGRTSKSGLCVKGTKPAPDAPKQNQTEDSQKFMDQSKRHL